MKKAHKIAIAALVICLLIFHFAVPRKAVAETYRIHAVEKNGQLITEKLTEADIDRMEALVKEASCTRWKNPLGPVPAHLRDSHYRGAADLGHGAGYRYPHNYPGHWVKQQYLPDDLVGAKYYEYGPNKLEQSAKQYWESIKK